MHSAFRFGALVGTLLLLGPGTSPADESIEEQYEPTIDFTEAAGLLQGNPLDERAPDYCAKARDLCLLGVCGSFERKDVRPGCWKECTVRQYKRCTERPPEERAKD